ncbi:hypothetical protein QYE76_042396 [Lolium multiflorum]|uniref:Uncharacterized protein n=1 Tax=Lolium multiflorum TaxID=4521 RepID=A0AAD8TH44_LOLMU|nr:hypothetical protein QYE76_042396 [Lolium multiflorum]
MFFFLTGALFSSVNILRSLTGLIQKRCGDIVTAIIRNTVAAIIQSTVGYEVTANVLVLLSNTLSYHLRRHRLPLKRPWPTRPPPENIRVDDGTRIPHQGARPGR